jgi:hypothetical protein
MSTTRSTDNATRFWFSFWGGPKFANGWCFGDTPELALAAAIADAQRWARIPAGSYTVTLQQDVSPANYFDFKVVL